jgi:hypothetical protein
MSMTAYHYEGAQIRPDMAHPHLSKIFAEGADKVEEFPELSIMNEWGLHQQY